MAIRLVAVDVDGTLVTADQRVLPRVQAAAQRALEHGIQLVLCTGRAPGECWYILDALPQIRYAVTQTGAIAQDLKTGETLYHCPLSPDDARLIYSHVRRYDGLVNFFSGGIVYNAKQQMAQFERYYPADFRWLFERSARMQSSPAMRRSPSLPVPLTALTAPSRTIRHRRKTARRMSRRTANRQSRPV